MEEEEKQKEMQKVILIVDDSQLIREILSKLLKDDYYLLKATNGNQAIRYLDVFKNKIAVVLLDLIMPEVNGFQVLEYMNKQKYITTIPVIVITAEEAEKTITQAYDLGASEVVNKPFNPNVVKKRIRNLIDLYTHKNYLQQIVNEQTEALRIKNEKITKTNDIMVDALSAIIEYRSLESGQHTKRIRSLTKILLEYLSSHFPEHYMTPQVIHMISSASTLHDIGKIAIPDSILLKPGKLTKEEFEIMKTHTTKGSEMLFQLGGLNDEQYLSYCYEICLYHHERWDGSGYPDGLAGKEIPLVAHVVALADVYDALTHKRIYKPAYPYDVAAKMIMNGECGAFSPSLLHCFSHILPQFEEIMVSHADIEE